MESQHNISKTSLYDNVNELDIEIMEKIGCQKSKSFHNNNQQYCKLEANFFILETPREPNSIDDNSSPPVKSLLDDQLKDENQTKCGSSHKCDKPFCMTFLRQIRKLSYKWSSCKNLRRGRDHFLLVLSSKTVTFFKILANLKQLTCTKCFLVLMSLLS